MRQTAVSALVAGGLMLFFGFYYRGGISSSAVYNTSVDVFIETLRIGGAAMLVSAALCWLRWRHALPVDAVLAGGIGVLLAGTGAVWLIYGDVSGVLNLIFGGVFFNSAWRSWAACRATAEAAGESLSVTPSDSAAEAMTGRAEHAVARAEALKRVLDQKRKAAGAGAAVPGRSAAEHRTQAPESARRHPPDSRSAAAGAKAPPDAVPEVRPTRTAPPAPVPPARITQEAAPPTPEPASPTPGPATPTPEPAPEGFLAELGRGDDRP